MTLSIREIAARCNPSSLAAAKRALREAGLKQTLAADVLAELAIVKQERATKRRSLEAVKRRGNGRDPVRLPAGNPAQRLALVRVRDVITSFVSAFRQPAHGDVHVALTDDPEQVGVSQATRADWTLYAKSYRHGPARVQDTTVVVPTTWRVRVARKGLAVLDGMMTLDASPIEGAPHGVSIYAATWLEQGRGTSVRVVDGFIAVRGEHSYHGSSAEKALAGLRRKISGATWAAQMRTTSLEDIVARISNVVVRLADARAIGACEYGIRSWCARTGISYDAGEATVSEIYAAYQINPAPEARGAILHAARRARRLLNFAD